MVKIAVDMMGGDNAPGIVLEAVEKAINDFKDLEIILFGDEKQYTLNHERIEFRHCSEKLRWKMSLYVPLKEKKTVQWYAWQKRLNLVRQMAVYLLVIQVL